MVSAVVAVVVIVVAWIAISLTDASFIEFAEEIGFARIIIRTLGTALIAIGLVAVCVRLGLRMSRCDRIGAWIAFIIPIVSVALMWLLPTFPLERLSDEAFEMFAVSHPTWLANAILQLALLVEIFSVVIVVSYAFGHLSHRLSVPPNNALEQTREG